MGTLRSQLTLLLIAALVALTPALGCKGCGADEEAGRGQASSEPPLAELPATYPQQVRETAPSLARHVPTEASFALFFASHGAIARAVNDALSWGVVDPGEVQGRLETLALHYGLDPGRARSYRDAGLDLRGGLAVARVGRNHLVVVEYDDRARFEVFLDRVLNEEVGRPRPRPETHGGHHLEHLYVLGQDMATVVYLEDRALITTGVYFDEAADSSLELMKRVLDLEASAALAESAAFTTVLDAVGAEGAVMAYTADGDFAAQVLEPLLAGVGPMGKRFIDEIIREGVEGYGVVARASPTRLELASFARLPGEQLAATLSTVSPAPESAAALARFLSEEATATARLTFDPRQVEARVIEALGAQSAAAWQKIKEKQLRREQGPFVLFDVTDEILYNLAGQALLVVHAVDGARLAEARTPLDQLAALDAALYLPLRDGQKAASLFGKVDLFKSMITGNEQLQAALGKLHAELTIANAGGAVIIGLTRPDAPPLELIYQGETLALVSGARAHDAALAGLASAAPGWQPAPDAALARMTAEGAVWGLLIEVDAVADVLTRRYASIRSQITRVLAPLDRATIRATFQPEGLGISVGLELGGEAAP